jgi:hypothetical protein
MWLRNFNHNTTLEEHEVSPETSCKEWGVYLGVSGSKRRFILVGKDVVMAHNEWGATRILLGLVDGVELILPREQVVQMIEEARGLGRRIRLRKQGRREAEHIRVA